MAKKIPFQLKKKEDRRAELDQWVAGAGGGPDEGRVTSTPTKAHPARAEKSNSPKPGTPAPGMKRMTFDIPKALHSRIKQTCAARDQKMSEEIRRILDEAFPPLL